MYKLNEYNKLGKNAQKTMIVSNLLVSLIILLILGTIYVILHAFSIPDRVYLVYNIIAVFILFLSLLYGILEPTVGYNRYRYRINSNSIEKISGVFFLERSIVPIRRIQQVLVGQGPIARKFGIATLELITAGANFQMNYLPLEVANQISEALRIDINTFAEKQLLKTENYKGVIKSIENKTSCNK